MSYLRHFRAAEREMREASRCAGTMWAPMHRDLAEMYLALADERMEIMRKAQKITWGGPWPEAFRKVFE